MPARHGCLTIRPLDPERLRRPLRWLSVLFLALPTAIFLVGWLRPPIAALLLICLGVAVAGLAGNRRAVMSAETKATVRLPALLLALGPPLVLSLVSGAGGLGFRNWDWVKHEAVLKDLVTQAWPVRYLTESGTTALTYYVGYHLPAAAVGKVAGWTAANLAIAATSLAGVTLAVLWLVVFARGAPLLCGGLFTVFSGMDVLGGLLIGRWPPDPRVLFANFHLEWWASHWQYSSNASLVDFVPNQAIAGWLLAALLVDAVQTGRKRFPIAALLAIGLLWSPFVVIGAVPLGLAFLVSARRPFGAAVRDQATAANTGGALLGIALALYFAGRFLPLSIPARYHPATTPAARGAFWLVPAELGPTAFFASYALFVTCEFLLLWGLLVKEHRGLGGGVLRPLLLAAGGTLLVLPLFHWGLFNDVVMRVSIPALFVLQIAAVQALRDGVRGGRRVAIVAILAVGALYGANLLRMNMQWVAHARRLAFMPRRDEVPSLFDMQLHDPAANRREFVVQYLGSTDSGFFRLLARPSPPRLVGQPDATVQPHP